MNADGPSKRPLVFYRSDTGREPVKAWLKSLDREERLAIGADLQRAQYRWPVGMPLCRALGDGLWEIRTTLPNRNESRVFICFHGGSLIALHGFVKKTRKTPDAELSIARRRKKDAEDD